MFDANSTQAGDTNATGRNFTARESSGCRTRVISYSANDRTFRALRATISRGSFARLPLLLCPTLSDSISSTLFSTIFRPRVTFVRFQFALFDTANLPFIFVRSSHHVSFLFFLSFLFELIFVSFLFFFDARIVWYAWLPLVDEIRLLDHRVTIWRFEIKKKKKKRRGLGTYYRGKTRRTLLINRPVNKQASSYGRAINRRVINSGPTRRRFLNGKRILR